MKLHGNAALSLNKRRRLVHRVLNDGWSLTKLAAAAEIVPANTVSLLSRLLSPFAGHHAPDSVRRRARRCALEPRAGVPAARPTGC
jgi:hypothetical protein